MTNFFLIHRWGPSDVPFVMYTEHDLGAIPRNFGHPLLRATKGLLRRSGGGKLDPDGKRAISNIAIECRNCNVHAAAPRRFKLTVGTEDLRFNHTLQVDTMFLTERPVLYMVDVATHFCAGTFLKSQCAKEIWTCIQNMWTLVFAKPLDYLSVYQGSSYVSNEMKARTWRQAA